MTSCTRTNLSSKYFRFGEEKNLKISLECIYLFSIFFLNINSKIYEDTSDEYVIRFLSVWYSKYNNKVSNLKESKELFFFR